ncbi:Structure-specific endonuclease subunit SLX4 [Camponotus japonicus]
MDVEKNRLHKPNSPNRRLRLKKSYKESIDNKASLSNDSDTENKKNSIASTSKSSYDDDSILDFKSPKRKNTVQTKIIKSNKPLDKSKKNVLCTKSKVINNGKKFESNKLLQNKKIQHDAQQPSIESSFFKSEKKDIDSPQNSINVKTAYVCPLCFKNLKDENLQTVHMKSCAIKNNVSTKTLMDAMELQERQAAERKSLGLLSAPILQDKKKPVSRKMVSHDDPDFQLALVLSKSLYEKEEMEEWEEAQIVAISSNSSLPDSNVEYPQKATLQNFGFTSSKNISPTKNWPTNKIKKKGKPIEPTILQKRTAAEKEHILTERIAEILMAYKDFTQRSQEEQVNNIKKKIVLKNQLLQQLHQTENTLWDRTKLTPTQKVFYVKQLSPYITPLKKKEKLNEEQNIEQLMEQNIDNKIISNNKQILETKEMKVIEVMDNNEELISSNAVNTCCKEKTFLDILATNWRNMLNDSSASDIIIFVKNARHIWAHKLVFYARCTNILLDVISNDTEFSTAKEKICWFDVDYDVALAFLEFVYCGIINEHSKIFNSNASLSDIRFLARKYKVNDLFVYLRQKEFKSNITEIKHEICRKSTENVYADMEKTLNVSKIDKSFNASLNRTCDVSENIHCSQRILLQENVNDNLHSLEDNDMSVKDCCVLQDKKSTLIRISEKINSRSNTPANSEISNASPDMFDDTPDMKHKSIVHFNNHEDSNINILLSLIKQDKDVDICSQTSLTGKGQNVEYSQLDKDISINLKNVEQNVMEINSDSESNSQKLFIDNIHENSIIDTPQSSKSKSIQDSSLKLTKQKSNLTLFIEEIERQNAKLDSDLDSDIEYPVGISPIRYKNPFHINRYNSEDSETYHDNVEQSIEVEKKPSRLSIIEQRMQSYADKNPEFYSHLSNNDVDIKQTNTLHMVPISKMTMESSCNNTQSFISLNEKDINISEQIAVTKTSAICSPQTANPLFNETVLDVETDEEEISMYSKYMKDHKDNSIANYRAVIRNGLSNSLSHKNISSDSINKNNDTENNVLDKIVLTQKDADIIVSSDTEVESISSSINHPAVLKEDDFDYEDIMPCSTQQSKRITEYNKQNIESQKSNQFVQIEDIPKTIITDLEEEKDFNGSTKSNQEEFNASSTEMTSNDIDFNISFMQKKSRFNESNDDQKEKSISSPIMVPSSPEFLNVENLLLDVEHRDEFTLETNTREPRKSDKPSFNFEDEIYLANVDVNMYRKHVLEKSQSTSILNTTEFKKNSARRRNNKNNDENIRVNNSMANNDIIPVCENLDNNPTFFMQNSVSIRKFKKKSLSEGQININRLHNREISTHASIQFKCNYNENIENTKTALKIIEKDVTPPPNYIGMKTPELNKEMKKYGLKVQKRGRAVKLLTHIYNELHPLVPIAEITSIQEVTEISSDEDEGPPSKKRNVDNNSLEKLNNPEDSDDKVLCSPNSDSDVSSGQNSIGKEMELSDTESLPENPSNITEAFTGLLNVDKDLHNKILQYEPVNIKELHHTLRTHGFKCKFSNLMDYLDEQCITFYMPEQGARTRRKKYSST